MLGSSPNSCGIPPAFLPITRIELYALGFHADSLPHNLLRHDHCRCFHISSLSIAYALLSCTVHTTLTSGFVVVGLSLPVSIKTMLTRNRNNEVTNLIILP